MRGFIGSRGFESLTVAQSSPITIIGRGRGIDQMPDRPNVPPDRPTELQLQTPAQPEPRPVALPVGVTPEDLDKISWQTSIWPTRPPRPEALLSTIRRLSKARRYTYLDHGDERWEERFAEQGFDAFDM